MKESKPFSDKKEILMNKLTYLRHFLIIWARLRKLKHFLFTKYFEIALENQSFIRKIAK